MTEPQPSLGRVLKQAFGAAMAMLGLLAAGVVLTNVWQKRPQPLQVNYVGTPVTGPGLSKLENYPDRAMFLDGDFATTNIVSEDDLLRPDELDAFLFVAIQQPANLRGWQICNHELRAEALARNVAATGMEEFPYDKPRELTGEDLEHNTQKVARLKTAGSSYEQAVAKAGDAGIACIREVKPIDQWRWLQFAVEYRGEVRPVAIPDSLVVRYALTLEEHVYRRSCMSKLQQVRAAVATRPISSSETTDISMFSEHDRVYQLAHFDGQMNLLSWSGYADC